LIDTDDTDRKGSFHRGDAEASRRKPFAADLRRWAQISNSKTFETQRNGGRGGKPKNPPLRHGDTEKKTLAADLRRWAQISNSKTFETHRNGGRGGKPKNPPLRHGGAEKSRKFTADREEQKLTTD
jgi:hypothetical protein